MKPHLITITGLLLSTLLLYSCKSSDKDNSPGAVVSVSKYEVLLIGNSHSSNSGLPETLALLISTGTNESVNVQNAPNWKFLDERINDGETQEYLESRKWTHVFLQAQKYSTSGTVTYSTEAAKEWIRRVKAQDATPIMFPEWPRKNNFEEGTRIHVLHESIVAAEPGCLAPIGLAWDASILAHPAIELHAADGNHSNRNGALLTAYVMYEAITGKLATDLPEINNLSISSDIQDKFKTIASLTIEQYPPCAYFP